MKTTTFIIGIIFLISGRTVFAGNDLESPGANLLINESLLKILAPVAPKEANFDEEVYKMDKNLMIPSLAPTTPEAASFDDTVPTEMNMKEILQLLAPKSPREVEFNDPMETIIIPGQLRPNTPKEASFEDIK